MPFASKCIVLSLQHQDRARDLWQETCKRRIAFFHGPHSRRPGKENLVRILMVLRQALLQMAARVGGLHTPDMAARTLLRNHEGALQYQRADPLRTSSVENPQAGALAMSVDDWPIYSEVCEQRRNHFVHLAKIRLQGARRDRAFGTSLPSSGIEQHVGARDQGELLREVFPIGNRAQRLVQQ